MASLMEAGTFPGLEIYIHAFVLGLSLSDWTLSSLNEDLLIALDSTPSVGPPHGCVGSFGKLLRSLIYRIVFTGGP